MSHIEIAIATDALCSRVYFDFKYENEMLHASSSYKTASKIQAEAFVEL